MTFHVPFRLGLTAAALMLALPALAADKVIKVGINVTEQHYEYKAMEKFKEHVETQSDGAMRVELFANTLGNDLEILDAIKLGTVQMNLPTPSVLGNLVKDFRLPDLPFIFPDEETANRVADSDWAKKLLAELEPVGYVGLAIGNFGFRHISNNVRPIATLEDLDDLKIRVMQNSATLDVFRSIGTNPTPMGFAEVFSGLQLGTIDGQENPYTNTYQARFFEVQKYISNSGHAYSWVILVIGKKFYDGLDDDERRIVDEAAAIWADHMRKSSRETDAAALQEIVAAGTTYTEITPEERSRIRQAAFPTVEKYGNEISPEMFRELVEVIESGN
ncbi:MAG: TRAP transporter substrate-binding protein [Tropicimonas sp.]|uniref:TRAP transporter substrate-binding protein n=1 Tax=Tropicimonas sp. TaxID=2067044 RepID=UPI003A83D8C1